MDLKSIRESRGLSQSQLAKASNVPVRTLQKYEIKELNINNCKAINIYKNAKVLNCRMEDLIEIDEKDI